MGLICIYIHVFVLFVYTVDQSQSYDFDQDRFMVSFSPYVKLPNILDVIPSMSSYTMENVKTTLEVVSQKFSKVVSSEPVAKFDDYSPFLSYWLGSYASVFTSQAAARINKERNNKSIGVVIEVPLVGYFSNRTITEIFLALEATQTSNKIFPGTVESILVDGGTNSAIYASDILLILELFRNTTTLLGVKLGATINCNAICLCKENFVTFNTTRQIVAEADYVVCDAPLPHTVVRDDPELKFWELNGVLLKWRKFILREKRDADLWYRIGWPSANRETVRTIEKQRIFWEKANAWAVETNSTVVMIEAFNTPIRPHASRCGPYGGWWKLTNNSLINSLDGYVEKVHEIQAVPKVPTAMSTLPSGSSTSRQNVVTATLNALNLSQAPQNVSDKINDASPSELGIPTLVSIIIGTIAVLLAATSLAVIAFRRRRPRERRISDGNFLEFFHGSVADNNYMESSPLDNALSCPYDMSYEISRDNLQIETANPLGTGQIGCVFRATITKDNVEIPVALKTTRRGAPTTAVSSLLSEIKILMYLETHDNIVGMIGAYTAEVRKGIVYLATELCSLGSLEDYLRKAVSFVPERYAKVPHQSNRSTVAGKSFYGLIRWAHEIACGMEYLGTKHVIHADLATRNVLLTMQRIAKITDFGLSRRMYDYQNYVKTKQEPLPWRWMAIESLKRCEFSEQSDVWSYGVTLWEIFTNGDTPYPGLSWTLDFVNRLNDGLRLERPPSATVEIYELMRQCWHVNPGDRLTFTDLKQLTNDMMDCVCEASNAGGSVMTNNYG